MTIKSWRRSSILTDVKYENFAVGYPHAPTIGTATDGGTGTTVSVAFTPVGSATSYTALSSPGSFTASGASSPLTVSGLTAGTAYTFQVKATNSIGDSAYSAASNSVTPAVPTAFTSIATVTAAGGETSLTFSSIPGTYTDLQIRGIGKVQGGASVNTASNWIYFNGVTTTTYAYHYLQGNGSSASTTGVSGDSSISALSTNIANSFSSLANIYGASIYDIADYTNTSKTKTIKAIGGAELNQATTAAKITMGSGLWTGTSAITSITIQPISNTFAAGTTYALYGIKAAL